ncbi:SixA phosphatase family protein [Pelagibius sp.]|uniref:SixA phosphatase family protein n=1 Tax=Pelagibius sp. TaxID=1931238 RepID=UPI003B502E54
MPHLLLLRHAKSSWDDPSLADFDRPLAPRGERAAREMGKWIGKRKWRPTLVLCSTAARAVQTLDLVLAALPKAPEVRLYKSLYLAPPSRMLRLLESQPGDAGSIMIVAHNPGMENLAAQLARGDTAPAARRMAEKYPTAALAHFKLAAWPRAGRATAMLPAALKDFIRPRDLA